MRSCNVLIMLISGMLKKQQTSNEVLGSHDSKPRRLQLNPTRNATFKCQPENFLISTSEYEQRIKQRMLLTTIL